MECVRLKFASMYSGFGSQVTVLQDSGTFLAKEDEDIAAEIKKLLEERGVEFRLGAKIKGADYTVLRDQIYIHPTMPEAFNDLFAV